MCASNIRYNNDYSVIILLLSNFVLYFISILPHILNRLLSSLTSPINANKLDALGREVLLLVILPFKVHTNCSKSILKVRRVIEVLCGFG